MGRRELLYWLILGAIILGMCLGYFPEWYQSFGISMQIAFFVSGCMFGAYAMLLLVAARRKKFRN